MKLFILVMFVCFLFPVQPEDTDRYTYCEICLTAAQVIEKAMKDAPVKSRQTVVENLISGGVCKKLLSYKHDHVSNNKMASSCLHLLESNHEKFRAALVNKEPKHVEIALCYEQSAACVGVKRHTFRESKTNFAESDIDALLRNNKERVRLAQPIRSGSPTHSRDEL